MGLFDRLKQEFIDVIEWTDTSSDTIIYKFPRFQNEIKMGAQLTVRESQVAVFFNEGKIADVYAPGRYELTTQNMPILATLKGWKYGFESPFKADVYFVNTKQFTDQKWGTKNPIMLRDPEFGPIRLRAHGNYAFRVGDAGLFIQEIAGTNPDFTVDQINEQLRNVAVSRGMDAIAESKIPILDLAANYDELSTLVSAKIRPDFAAMGLNLTQFLVENISLPKEVEEALDKRSSMGIIGNLGAYAQFQAANAMEEAAKNPNGGGIMGAGLGAGMGMGMMGQMGNTFSNTQFNPNQPAGNATNGGASQGPPPITQYYIAVEGQQTGPFTIDQVESKIKNKECLPSSQVWKQGMDGWDAANTLPELQAFFGAIPPPLP